MFFVIVSSSYPHDDIPAFVLWTTVVSSAMCLGSTMIPTARGIRYLSEVHIIPSSLSRGNNASWVTVIMAIMTTSTVIVVGSDTFYAVVDSVSVFIGLYFSISLIAALVHHRGIQAYHWMGLMLMIPIIIFSYIDMTTQSIPLWITTIGISITLLYSVWVTMTRKRKHSQNPL